MICLAISIIHFATLSPSAIPRDAANKPQTRYTVQLLSVRMENRHGLLSVHQSLREKGHLVYYYPIRIAGRQYLRLRAGIFENRTQAQAYGERLRRERGFQFFVAEADVPMIRFQDRFSIVTTPSGIWRTIGPSAEELYAPVRGPIDVERTKPQIAPDGTAVVFCADNQIVKVTLDAGETRILRRATAEDGLLSSIIRWSPDGRYIAYQDAAEWEFPTRLWLMRADGAENRCLAGDGTGRTKVKSFLWHPQKESIFYVVGPTHGTVSLGGSLCRIDLDGRHSTIVEADLSEGTEVLAEFRIADGLLQYRIARHHSDGREPQYSLHKRALDELD